MCYLLVFFFCQSPPLEWKLYNDKDFVLVTIVSPALKTVSNTLQVLNTYSMNKNEWINEFYVIKTEEF